ASHLALDLGLNFAAPVREHLLQLAITGSRYLRVRARLLSVLHDRRSLLSPALFSGSLLRSFPGPVPGRIGGSGQDCRPTYANELPIRNCAAVTRSVRVSRLFS